MSWPTGEMPAVAILEPGVVGEVGRPVPREAPGEVLVKTAFVGVCGTDLELVRGSSFYLTEGLNEYPVVFGHEWTGTVVATAPGVEGYEPGDRVVGQTILYCGQCRMCRRGRRDVCERRAEMGLFNHQGAAAEYARVPARALVKVPDGLSFADATMIEPTVTVVHGFDRVRCGFDDRVAVIGTGTLGLMAVQIGKVMAESVDAIGIEEGGLALAAELGADRTLRPEEAERDAYSVVIEASGSAGSTGMCARMLEPGGRAALLGVVNRPAEDFVPSFATLKDLALHGVLHGLDYYDQTARLFASGRVNPAPLIDHPLPASDAAGAFELMEAGNRTRPKLMLEFAGEGGG